MLQTSVNLMNFKLRAHEWLADRISWVQYPDVRPLSANTRRRYFKTEMHWSTRVMLALISSGVLLMSGAVLALVCLLAWAAITA
jgi:hypothetical protein